MTSAIVVADIVLVPLATTLVIIVNMMATVVHLVAVHSVKLSVPLIGIMPLSFLATIILPLVPVVCVALFHHPLIIFLTVAMNEMTGGKERVCSWNWRRTERLQSPHGIQ